ncbi:MAG: helix-turn-helix domain-containing protein [Defluviitaleaceae bacterium]|nr:helix-turn-helix domain-containing protein [Defluviitaleaceae bacterium]
MTELKINERIAFLRRQKGVTQEELANVLGVTNQSVSKWEQGSCCPDIQLLPDLAKYFGVSTDSLLGHSPAESLGDVIFKMKALFQATSTAMPKRSRESGMSVSYWKRCAKKQT